MEFRKTAIISILLIVLSSNGPYFTTDGLYWGFTEDDIYQFTMNYTGQYDDINDLQVYLQAEILRDISFHDTPSYPYPLPSVSLGTWDLSIKNHLGDEMWGANYRLTLSYHKVHDNGGISSTGLLYTPYAFPLGNHTGISQLILLWYSQGRYNQSIVTFLESENLWGFEIACNKFRNNTSMIPNWNVTMQFHVDYNKDDGFLAHYHGITTYIESGEIFQEVSLEREGYDWEVMTPYNVTIPIEQPPYNVTIPIEQPLPLNSSPIVTGMYVAAGTVWIVAIVFMITDYRSRIRRLR